MTVFRAAAVAVISILALFAGACSDTARVPRTFSSDQPVVVESCGDVAATAFDVVQAMLYRVSDLTVSEILSDDPPPVLEQLRAVSSELEARTLELGCSRDEVLADLRERADELEVDSPVAELLMEVVRAEFGIR